MEHDVGGLRPDGLVIYADSSALYDVAVIHPGAPSYVAKAALGSLASAKLKEEEKRARYAGLARDEGHAFKPLALESYGGIGEDFLGFLSDVASRMNNQPGGELLPDQRPRLQQIVSVALQNGNSRIQREGALFARSGGVPQGRRQRGMTGRGGYQYA